jgi:hypothetical protein
MGLPEEQASQVQFLADEKQASKQEIRDAKSVIDSRSRDLWELLVSALTKNIERFTEALPLAKEETITGAAAKFRQSNH